MKNLENLNVMLVFPDLMGKTKLREVLRNVLYKSEMNYEKDLKSLNKKITENLSGKIDFAFVSSKLPHSEISSFLTGLSNIDSQIRPAVIICMPGISFNSSGQVAGWYLEGAAGFIAEPFTADDISELLNTIVEETKKNNLNKQNNKAKKAAKFLINDSVFLIDEYAKLKSLGKEGGYTLKSLKSLNSAFANFFEQDREGFESALIDIFEKVKAPVISAQQLNQKKAALKVIKHPGTLIWEIMNKRGLAEERMAILLKIDVPELNNLLWGKTNIDQSLAQNLARALGMTAREWMKMQLDFDAYQQKIKQS